MKKSNLTLFVFGIFASLFLIGMVSAVAHFYPNSLTGTVDQGKTLDLTFTADSIDSSTPISDLTAISFTLPTLTSGSYTIPSSSVSILNNPTTITDSTNSSIITLRVVIPENQMNGTYTGVLVMSGTYVSSVSYNLPVTVVVKQITQPEEVSEVKSNSNYNTKLKLSIEEINVKGLGDEDDGIYPFDEVTVEVEVKNDNLDKIKSIELGWGLYDMVEGEFIVDDEESKFTLDDDDEKTITMKFKFDDLDALEGNQDDYRLYVWATGEIDDEDSTNDGEEITASVYEDLKIISDEFVVLENLAVPESVNCGSQFELVANVYNIGDSELEDVSVIIFNKELGINEDVSLGDIDEFEELVLDTILNVPENADEKNYTLKLTFYENNDILENDDNEAVFTIELPVSGMCQINANTELKATLQSGGKAGEDMTVQVSIKNSGKKSMTFMLSPTGYSDWADSAKMNQTSVTLKAGETKDVLVTLATKKSVSGDKTFNVDVLVGDQLVMEQPVTVKLAKSGFSLTDVQGSNQTLIMALVTLILIVAIITVAVRVSRK